MIAPGLWSTANASLRSNHNSRHEAGWFLSPKYVICLHLFLICAGITVWGVTLQLFLGACLLRELHAASILPCLVTKFFAGFLIVVSQMVVAYSALTAADVLKKSAARHANEYKWSIYIHPQICRTPILRELLEKAERQGIK